MREEQELMARVHAGIEVEAFLNGPIGAALLKNLKDECADAIEKLKTVNPREIEQVIELQLIIRRGEKVESWLAGIVQEGWYAEKQLKGEEL